MEVLEKDMWRQRQIAFNDIKAFQINTYRTKRGTTLYRSEVALSSGRILRLIQDVPDKEAPSPLGKKVGFATNPTCNNFKFETSS